MSTRLIITAISILPSSNVSAHPLLNSVTTLPSTAICSELLKTKVKISNPELLLHLILIRAHTALPGWWNHLIVPFPVELLEMVDPEGVDIAAIEAVGLKLIE
jgi:hypothetical protein